ncbi:helix-turn-helix domain-containing protein [Pseudomonas sichuanensis]|uniref:helix-turn-helix domain-containing protein n=1 Tax=Pseudomonas sichuanensis TaxID=2213015 RepID=UPI00215E8C4C|nr:helix-turn-helix domain-containing protein [Pseudomonas sichuanensis]UVK80782.1 helix-turn-helix domain-containing protein [Pseudomonas sichuanensis]
METESTGGVDKVTEQRMAELLGCTKRALEGRRLRGAIPEGVWMKHGGRIIYSKKRYDEWLESQWIFPQGLTSTTDRSGSGSCGKVLAEVKPFPTPRHRKASKLHPSFAIK